MAELLAVRIYWLRFVLKGSDFLRSGLFVRDIACPPKGQPPLRTEPRFGLHFHFFGDFKLWLFINFFQRFAF